MKRRSMKNSDVKLSNGVRIRLYENQKNIISDYARRLGLDQSDIVRALLDRGIEVVGGKPGLLFDKDYIVTHSRP